MTIWIVIAALVVLIPLACVLIYVTLENNIVHKKAKPKVTSGGNRDIDKSAVTWVIIL